jgi:hypothetical protein
MTHTSSDSKGTRCSESIFFVVTPPRVVVNGMGMLGMCAVKKKKISGHTEVPEGEKKMSNNVRVAPRGF